MFKRWRLRNDLTASQLRVGMYVIMTGCPSRRGNPPSTVLKVLAVEYPFVVFEYDNPSSPTMVMSATGPIVQPGRSVKDSASLDARGHYFREVSEEFAEAAAGVREPSWLSGDDDE